MDTFTCTYGYEFTSQKQAQSCPNHTRHIACHEHAATAAVRPVFLRLLDLLSDQPIHYLFSVDHQASGECAFFVRTLLGAPVAVLRAHVSPETSLLTGTVSGYEGIATDGLDSDDEFLCHPVHLDEFAETRADDVAQTIYHTLKRYERTLKDTPQPPC